MYNKIYLIKSEVKTSWILNYNSRETFFAFLKGWKYFQAVHATKLRDKKNTVHVSEVIREKVASVHHLFWL